MAEISAIQLVSTPDVEQNIRQVERLLAEADSETPRLTVLPECFACFGAGDRKLLELAESGTEFILEQIKQLASRYNTWIVAGTVPVLVPGETKFSACCWLVNDQGELVARYDKIHMFDVSVEDNTGSYCESRYTQAGSEVVVADTPFGKVGIAVCYDVRFPGLFQAMQDIDILVLPSAFTEKTGEAHWHTLLRARSIELQAYVIGANQGGVHENGRQTYGNSVIYSPWGDKLALIEKGEGRIDAAYDKGLISRIQSSMPVYQHRKFRSDFD
jgi:nitrilase